MRVRGGHMYERMLALVVILQALPIVRALSRGAVDHVDEAAFMARQCSAVRLPRLCLVFLWRNILHGEESLLGTQRKLAVDMSS